jgi:hypothetical protein
MGHPVPLGARSLSLDMQLPAPAWRSYPARAIGIFIIEKNSSVLHVIHLPSLAVSGGAADGNLAWNRGGLGDHSVRKHHSRNVLNDRPGHHAFEVCVELVTFDERRSPPNAIAGAFTRKTVTLKKTLSSEGGQIGAVCILDAPVPSCGRGTMHGKKVRCRSLIGDHRNPTQ